MSTQIAMPTRSSARVDEILSWYQDDSPQALANLRRILEHGRTGGSGKLVVLPVDQGFEHGPTRSFAPNPAGYDPRYHAQLAIDAGCSAHALPLGACKMVAPEFASDLPLILKCNSADGLYVGADPEPAVTAAVEDAVRLGCAAVGFTIYPGSSARNRMYENLRHLAREAADAGLPLVVWSYPRGSGVSEQGRTAVDVVAYAAHLACQLGAHIVKVKPPTDVIESAAARKVLERSGTPWAPWPIACATSSSPPSTGTASSSSRVGRPREPRRSSRRTGRQRSAAGSERSWAATASSVRTTRRSSSSTTSWTSTWRPQATEPHPAGGGVTCLRRARMDGLHLPQTQPTARRGSLTTASSGGP